MVSGKRREMSSMKESERTVMLADEQNIRPLLVFSEEVINNANVAALDRVMAPTYI
jgi:hypothetical protein